MKPKGVVFQMGTVLNVQAMLETWGVAGHVKALTFPTDLMITWPEVDADPDPVEETMRLAAAWAEVPRRHRQAA